MKVAARDLQVGDVVEVFPGAFGTAIVSHVGETELTLFRPYAVTAGFTYDVGNSRTICYTGVETFNRPRDNFAFEHYRRERFDREIL